jgi:radical SAM protein with 4Fe4S-binding SPASM domain
MKPTEFTAGLSLTEQCNMKCSHCYIGQKKLWKEMGYKIKEMSLEQVRNIIPTLRGANVTRINLGGGETTLHKEFISIVEELYRAEMKISLTTNGTTFPIYRNHLHLFNDIGVSIDFPDERHSKFRENENAFSRAVDTLHKLVDEEIRTELVTCIMGVNCHELPKIYELAKSIGVNMWRLNRFHSSKNDLDRFNKNYKAESMICRINNSLSCSPQQMKDSFEFLRSVTPAKQDYAIPDPLFRTYVGGKGVTDGSPCGRMAFRIMTNGDITPNVFTNDIAGNIFKDNFDDIINHPSFVKYKKHSPEGKCAKCVNYSSCRGGDTTDSYLMSGSLCAPDPFCFLNPAESKKTGIIDIDHTRFVHETYLGTIYIPIGRK